MASAKANELSYEEFEILGRKGLFTCMRVDRKSLPEGLYAYDLRDNDSTGEICELKSHVMVNHWGTIILKEPMEGADEGIMIESDDYNYLGTDMTIEDFSESGHTFEQTMMLYNKT
ncbi:MAG: hypothetical protein HFE79_14010 [Ruminiclostridium sp.]|nr:hypothetical protein [Ruminiclostridium sp.]